MAYREGGNSNLSLKCSFYWLILSPIVRHPSSHAGTPYTAASSHDATLNHLSGTKATSRQGSTVNHNKVKSFTRFSKLAAIAGIYVISIEIPRN